MGEDVMRALMYNSNSILELIKDQNEYNSKITFETNLLLQGNASEAI
jgi:hypothetical protein